MNIIYSSGKKFKDSAFQHESYFQLKRDEQRQKIAINLTFLVILLLTEYFLLSIFTRF
jgi:hypothetical protein